VTLAADADDNMAVRAEASELGLESTRVISYGSICPWMLSARVVAGIAISYTHVEMAPREATGDKRENTAFTGHFHTLVNVSMRANFWYIYMIERSLYIFAMRALIEPGCRPFRRLRLGSSSVNEPGRKHAGVQCLQHDI
jgi:hypothetical protein